MSRSILRNAWKEIIRRKKRSFITVIGYFLIVSFVVLSTNILFSARAAKAGVLNNLGTHFLVFFPRNQNNPETDEQTKRLLDPKMEGFFSDPAVTKLFPLSYVEDIKASPHIKAASSFLLFRFKEPKTQEIFCLGGFDPGNPAAVNGTSLQKSDIIKGEFMSVADRGVALLEEGYAVYKNLDVGTTFEVAGLPLKVKGIVRPGIRPAKADIYVRFDDAAKAINTRLNSPLSMEANVVLVEVASAVNHTLAMEDVKNKFPACMIDTYACFDPAFRTSHIDENSVLLVLTIILILFAAKSQLAATIEKRHDIGIMSSIGWSNNRIFHQLLTETAIQAILGGILGCLLGSGLTYWVSNQGFIDSNPVINHMDSLFISFMLALIGGITAAFFVVRSMVFVPPAQNLGRT